MQKIRKICYSDGVEGQVEVKDEADNSYDEDITLQAIRGIKTKPSIGRPKKKVERCTRTVEKC